MFRKSNTSILLSLTINTLVFKVYFKCIFEFQNKYINSESLLQGYFWVHKYRNFESTIQVYFWVRKQMEYCCHVWACAPICFKYTSGSENKWNTVVMSGLVLLVATRNIRWASKMNMQDCLSFPCCLSWTLGSSSKFSQLKSLLW